MAITLGDRLPPILVQASDEPILRSRSSAEQLLCKCGNVLVDGYSPGLFVDIGFRCFRCGETTWTARDFPSGEPPHWTLLNMGEAGSSQPKAEIRSIDSWFKNGKVVVEIGAFEAGEKTYTPRICVEGVQHQIVSVFENNAWR